MEYFLNIKSIINSLKEIPKAIKINEEEVSKPNSILIKLDGQENTVATMIILLKTKICGKKRNRQ